MVEVLFEKDKAILKFPKGWLAMDYMQKFLERLRIEAIIELEQHDVDILRSLDNLYFEIV